MTTPTTNLSTGLWKLDPYSSHASWADNPIFNEDEKIISITVPHIYPPALMEGTLADEMNKNTPSVVREGVDAIFKYYNKDAAALQWGGEGYQAEGFGQIGVLSDAYAATVNGGVIMGDSKPTVSIKVLYKVEINEDNGWDFFKEGGPVTLKGYDFSSDPRSREIGCIDFRTFTPLAGKTEPAKLNLLKSRLDMFKVQIQEFRDKGGAFTPPDGIDLDQEINNIDLFMTELKTFLAKPGQGNNLISAEDGIPLKSLYGTQAKLYFGVDFDYVPYFTILELPLPDDTGTEGGPLLRLKDGLTISGKQLADAGYLYPKGDSPNRWRINCLTGIEKLQEPKYKRSLGLLLRVDEFLSDARGSE